MAVRDSEERLSKGGVYILETGLHLFLWVGASAQQELLLNIFGTPSFSQIDPSLVRGSAAPDVAIRLFSDVFSRLPRRYMRLDHVMNWKHTTHDVSVSDKPAGAGQPVLSETARNHRVVQSAEITIHEGKLLFL